MRESGVSQRKPHILKSSTLPLFSSHCSGIVKIENYRKINQCDQPVKSDSPADSVYFVLFQFLQLESDRVVPRFVPRLGFAKCQDHLCIRKHCHQLFVKQDCWQVQHSSVVFEDTPPFLYFRSRVNFHLRLACTFPHFSAPSSIFVIYLDNGYILGLSFLARMR